MRALSSLSKILRIIILANGTGSRADKLKPFLKKVEEIEAHNVFVIYSDEESRFFKVFPFSLL